MTVASDGNSRTCIILKHVYQYRKYVRSLIIKRKRCLPEIYTNIKHDQTMCREQLHLHFYKVMLLFVTRRKQRGGAIEMTLVRPLVRYSFQPSVRPSVRDLVSATPPTSLHSKFCRLYTQNFVDVIYECKNR